MLHLERKFQREKLALAFRHHEMLLALDGKRLCYPNQTNAANQVVQAYANGALLVVLMAQPGTGKTGTAIEVMRRLATHENDDVIVLERNMSILSGMSDTEWRSQFERSVAPVLQNVKIRHRGQLKDYCDELIHQTQALIITDECHIASDAKMTMGRLLHDISLDSVARMETRNVRLLEISATPESVSLDAEKWGDRAAHVYIEPGPTYKGFRHMLEDGRLLDAPILDTADAAKRLFETFRDRFSSPKYFVLRLGAHGHSAAYVIAICREFDWLVLTHTSAECIDDMDARMQQAPAKSTVIIIKGFWRASKRLVQAHVGATYERPPKIMNVTSASQGLTARFCDNFEYSGDQIDVKYRPLHFVHRESIEQYLAWFEQGGDYRLAPYSGLRIKSAKGAVHARTSKVHPENIAGLAESVDVSPSIATHERTAVIILCDPKLFADMQAEIPRKRHATISAYILSVTADAPAEFRDVLVHGKCVECLTPQKSLDRWMACMEADIAQGRTHPLVSGKNACTEKCWQVVADVRNVRFIVVWQVARLEVQGPKRRASRIDQFEVLKGVQRFYFKEYEIQIDHNTNTFVHRSIAAPTVLNMCDAIIHMYHIDMAPKYDPWNICYVICGTKHVPLKSLKKSIPEASHLVRAPYVAAGPPISLASLKP